MTHLFTLRPSHRRSPAHTAWRVMACLALSTALAARRSADAQPMAGAATSERDASRTGTNVSVETASGTQPSPGLDLRYGSLPLSFEPATDPRQTGARRADFLARGRGYLLSLSASAATLAPIDDEAAPDASVRRGPAAPGQPHPITLRFVGSRSGATGRAETMLPGKVHYLTGNDPAAWRTNIPTYAAVRYDGVYPGIDLVYYGRQGELEYDFLVAPGADPAAIALSFDGTDAVTLDDGGDLLLWTSAGAVRQHKPFIYQEVDGQRRPIAGAYRLDGAHVRLDIGAYDARRPLVIDPVLVFSGGVGGAAATDVAVDGSGNAYVSGFTHPPANEGEVGVHGARDAFVRKINAAGTAVLWTAFIGGSRDDWAYSLAIDASGSVYVTGSTRSLDFPTVNAFDFTYNGPAVTTSYGDAFVAKLTPDGATLTYSTYLGTATDDRALGIAVRNGNAYVVGQTSAGFPTTAGAFQAVKPGTNFKGFVTQLDATGSALVYSTYLGAPSNGATASGGYSDQVTAIALDSAGNAYLTGVTQSYNFPTLNPAQTWSTPTTFVQDGRKWAFITKLNPTGSALVYSTYLGGGLSAHGPQDGYHGTEAAGIAVDAGGHAYVTGATRDVNFPTTANAFDKTCPIPPGRTAGGCLESFVTKLSADGRTFLYSSYLGGTDASIDSASGIAVDAAGRAYLAGTTNSLDFPLVDPFQTTGGGDVFFTVVNPAGTGLEYSTALSGTDAGDSGAAIALDASGNAYLVGTAISSDFPRVGGLPQAGGGHVSRASGFLAKFSAIGCAYTVAPTTDITATATGGSGVVNLATTAGCGWATTTTVPWLTLTPGGADASTAVTYTVAPNTSTNPRTGTFTVAKTTIVVRQAGRVAGACTYALSPSTTLAPSASGGTGSLTVTTTASCAWEATSIAPWVTLGAGRTGSGTLTYTVNPNLTSSARTGSLFIAGQTVQVNQAAGPATNCPTDADCDGLPTAWETQFGLNASLGAGVDGPDGDADGDGRSNLQELAQGTHPRGFFTRYLAEGATSTFFDTRIALANPNGEPALTLLRFLRAAAAPVSEFRSIGARTRVTITPKTLPTLSVAEFSTVVESDSPIVVDRTMEWDGTGYGSHAETSLSAPATTWYLAEGATHSGFNLFYLIQNPTDAAAQVEVTYLRPAPAAPVVTTYSVGPNSRFNIWVNQQGAALASTDVSAVIRSTNAVPIIVERAMYLNRGSQTFGAGHNSAGVTAPATRWFLAEGATGNFFDMFILVANPGATPASLTATYLLPSGQTVTRVYDVAGNSRFNIWVDLEDAALADTAVSTTLVSTVPVIVERSMWWPNGSGSWLEAHNSPGATDTGTRWALAEGEVGGSRGYATYILLANTSPLAGDVRVTLLFEDGTTSARTFPVNATSRFNVSVEAEFPTAIGRRFGAVIESLGATPVELVVERAIYSNAAGVTWAAGTNTLGTRLQ